jgi:hypothetical protein
LLTRLENSASTSTPTSSNPSSGFKERAIRNWLITRLHAYTHAKRQFLSLQLQVDNKFKKIRENKRENSMYMDKNIDEIREVQEAKKKVGTFYPRFRLPERQPSLGLENTGQKVFHEKQWKRTSRYSKKFGVHGGDTSSVYSSMMTSNAQFFGSKSKLYQK